MRAAVWLGPVAEWWPLSLLTRLFSPPFRPFSCVVLCCVVPFWSLLSRFLVLPWLCVVGAFPPLVFSSSRSCPCRSPPFFLVLLFLLFSPPFSVVCVVCVFVVAWGLSFRSRFGLNVVCRFPLCLSLVWPAPWKRRVANFTDDLLERLADLGLRSWCTGLGGEVPDFDFHWRYFLAPGLSPFVHSPASRLLFGDPSLEGTVVWATRFVPPQLLRRLRCLPGRLQQLAANHLRGRQGFARGWPLFFSFVFSGVARLRGTFQGLTPRSGCP